jgi:hypothetical protein
VAASALAAVGIEQAGRVSLSTAAVPTLGRSAFARYVGDLFQLQLNPSEHVALQLFKVRALRWAVPAPHARSGGSEHSFSLLFRGPLERPLSQETYRFAHGRMGGFELFIVPMRAEPQARYYEAIFN